MKTYREFINEIATQSTIIPKFDLRTPQTQTQTQSSKPVTRPSLMQQAQDLRAMRLRAIERQGGRENEAQRLRDQLSSAEQKVSCAEGRQACVDESFPCSFAEHARFVFCCFFFHQHINKCKTCALMGPHDRRGSMTEMKSKSRGAATRATAVAFCYDAFLRLRSASL